MNSKILLSLVGGVVVVVAASYFVIAPYAQKVEDAKYDAQLSAQKNTVTEGAFAPSFEASEKIETVVEEESTDDEKFTDPDSVPTQSAPSPQPAPVSSPAPVVKKYTLTTVALHSGESSCWSIINGAVYDLTAFTSKHPGGEKNILKICGKDGTSAFMGQHGGDSKPERTLAKYYLGQLER